MKKSLLTFALAFAALTFSLAVRAQAQTVTTFASFNGANGSSPFGSVVQALDGNFYGTTTQGPTAYGTFFRLTPSGKLTGLYNFCSKPHCTDGAVPYTAPVLGSDGNLYGVTSSGGSGSGTVYKMTVGGK